MKTLTKAYNATGRTKYIDGSLAACRNEGLDALRKSKTKGLRWVLTMDPDEHYEKPFSDCVAMRRMAECTSAWAWMFRFKNFRENGEWNWSETCRMFHLDEQGVMRMRAGCMRHLKSHLINFGKFGIHPNVRYALSQFYHIGLAKSPEEMHEKLKKYTGLLVDCIKDNPEDAGSWVALGLQFGNDDYVEEQMACYNQAVQCAGQSYLPFKESAALYLRACCKEPKMTTERLVNSHPFMPQAQKMFDAIAPFAVPQPKTGLHMEGVEPVSASIDLNELLKLRKASKTD